MLKPFLFNFNQRLLHLPTNPIKPERRFNPEFRLFGQFPNVAAQQFSGFKQSVKLPVLQLWLVLNLAISDKPSN